MLLPWFVQQLGQNGRYESCARILPRFPGRAGSRDRFGWLEGGRMRTYASASATCCARSMKRASTAGPGARYSVGTRRFSSSVQLRTMLI